MLNGSVTVRPALVEEHLRPTDRRSRCLRTRSRAAIELYYSEYPADIDQLHHIRILW